MSPNSLNPKGPSIQHQNQLLCAPYNNNNHDSASLSCCTFFDICDHQREIGDIRDSRHHDQEDDKRVFHGGGSSSSNYQVMIYNSNKNNNNNNSCLVSSPREQVMADPSSSACEHSLSLYKIEREENKNSYGSVRCLPPKIRLTRKMMSSTNPSSTYNTNSITRVCSDCNTSSTPLWRSGPNGPKTLCNACGIRQRKARKAMAEAAANGFATSIDASSKKIRVHHKEKKCRTNNFGKFKNKCKATTTTTSTTIATTTEETSHVERKLNFKGFAFSLRSNSSIQLLGDEEVAEAALLLMDLSCGFVHF